MSNPPKLSFGLNKAALPRQPAKKPAGKALFGAQDDDDEPSSSGPPTSHLAASRPRVSTASLTKAQKAKQKQELELDSSVFEYDEVYDNMKAAEKAATDKRKDESSDRKPKYINRLLETAELRKQDRLRAEDKMIQREREREGDEFAEKDQFVTPAYLKQQEELRKAEEEEKKREEAEAGKKGAGMTSFLKNYLDATSESHAAAVAASQSKKPVFGPTFNVAPPPKEKTDAELAAEAEAKLGRKIELNDDGEILDRRQLMTGGLNIVAKPKAPGAGGKSGGFAAPISQRAPPTQEEQDRVAAAQAMLHPGISAEERRRQQRERQSREIERQMVALEEKRKREAEEMLEHKVQKVAKRNDEDKVAALKRAAEERRKKREEERLKGGGGA
ncbi:hypothetical protein JCM8097_008281 [Rhodosporidiobolus ruineniae]